MWVSTQYSVLALKLFLTLLDIGKMVVCCRCNGDGKCKNCSCVKEGKNCSNCLQSRREKCLNMVHPPAPTTTPAQSPSAGIQPSTIAHALPQTSPTSVSTSVSSLLPTSSLLCPVSVQQPAATPSNAHLLPPPCPVVQRSFVWGDRDSVTFTDELSTAYSEVVHWKSNILWAEVVSSL